MFTLCLIRTIYNESMIGFGAYIHLMLTIDRFIAIVKAIEYRSIMTKNKYIIYTVFLLTHHILVFFVSFMFFPNNDKSAKTRIFFGACKTAHFINIFARYYMLGFLTILVLINIALGITLVIYLIIRQFKRKSLHQDGSNSNNLTRATYTLIIVSMLYAFLYIQLVVLAFVSSALNVSWRWEKLLFLSDQLFTVNNFINPLIYYIRMPEFRKEFHSLLLCRSRH